MVLGFLSFLFNLILFILFVYIPCVFIYGFFLADKPKEEDQIATDKLDIEINNHPINYEPRSIKVRDGFYEVRGLKDEKATIQKMTPDGARVYWVLTLPGNVVEQHWTKKAAVASAIEKMK